MKVKLLARKGANKPGTVLDLSTTSAEFLIRTGYAEAAGEDKEPKTEEPKKASGATTTVLGMSTPDSHIEIPTVEVISEDPPKPAARRGRPRKAE